LRACRPRQRSLPQPSTGCCLTTYVSCQSSSPLETLTRSASAAGNGYLRAFLWRCPRAASPAHAHVPSRCLSRAHTCPLPACLSRTCVCAQERELSPALQPHCRYCYTFDAAASAALRKSLYWSTLQDRAEAAAADSAARGGTEDAEGGRDTPAEQEGSAGSGSGVGGERAAEAREGGGNSGGGGSWAAGGGRGGGGNDGDSEKVRRLVPEPDDGRVPLLDVARMQAAAALLEGTHDFAAFQAKGGRVTTVRTIFKCAVEQDGASGRVR